MFAASTIKLLVQIGAFAILLSFESLFPFFKQRKLRAIHAGRNLFLGLINGLIVAFLFGGLTAATAVWTSVHHFGLFHWFPTSAWTQTVLAIMLFDLWMYVWHRANHRIPLLWRFHRVHHSDLELDVTSAVRFHTGEIIFSALLRLPIIALLGINLWQLLLYEILLQPIILLHHSNVALPEPIDRIFRAFFVTPHMHWVHHSQVREETDSNYSSIFSWWDRLGWSFCLREDLRSLKYGLVEFRDMRWQRVLGLLKTPFVKTSSAIF